VGELEIEYEGRIQFVLIDAEETANRGDEIEEYGFADQLHGMVGFTSNRTVVVKMPGHSFGKEEIVQAIEKLLDEDS
jgi:hypothetical protein